MRTRPAEGNCWRHARPRRSPPPPRSICSLVIDCSAYPHIVDRILSHAPRETWHVLRAVSRALRARFASLLFRHVEIRCVPAHAIQVVHPATAGTLAGRPLIGLVNPVDFRHQLEHVHTVDDLSCSGRNYFATAPHRRVAVVRSWICSSSRYRQPAEHAIVFADLYGVNSRPDRSVPSFLSPSVRLTTTVLYDPRRPLSALAELHHHSSTVSNPDSMDRMTDDILFVPHKLALGPIKKLPALRRRLAQNRLGILWVLVRNIQLQLRRDLSCRPFVAGQPTPCRYTIAGLEAVHPTWLNLPFALTLLSPGDRLTAIHHEMVTIGYMIFVAAGALPHSGGPMPPADMLLAPYFRLVTLDRWRTEAGAEVWALATVPPARAGMHWGEGK